MFPEYDKLVAWLQSCDNSEVRPVQVTISGKVYNGASYIDNKHPNKERRYYFLGRKPSHKRKASYCYSYNGQDYYIACYSDDDCLKEQYKNSHPFGHSFIIMLWNGKGNESIDFGERIPYERYPITISD